VSFTGQHIEHSGRRFLKLLERRGKFVRWVVRIHEVSVSRELLFIYRQVWYISSMNPLLDNYRQLVAKIDHLCQGITVELGELITCSAGCSGCCSVITIFPVEVAALQDALEALPAQEAETIRQHVRQQASGEGCPLLFNQRCLLYRARPIICRTHGLPIVYSEGGLRTSDCCPLNLSAAESVSGSHTVDLDKLNALLVAVNTLFLSQAGLADRQERLSIAQAVCEHNHS
jgi:Fe-S-cluster containining protein